MILPQLSIEYIPNEMSSCFHLSCYLSLTLKEQKKPFFVTLQLSSKKKLPQREDFYEENCKMLFMTRSQNTLDTSQAEADTTPVLMRELRCFTRYFCKQFLEKSGNCKKTLHLTEKCKKVKLEIILIFSNVIFVKMK